ncbi:cyclase family protein [Ktedonosporobacter rubrisoli]|uniref:Cyclase family protein n=1 Tax=Ktedonosporobacter rubrisoli TaxID=2509675 RepID=A0A4P6JKF0_KTERU|nr:cyclase family protein [Ktedonosporobacter rubrisoli]QBD75624.1 cyclase family protein [Ktedonosporobacter rubrisoli]
MRFIDLSVPLANQALYDPWKPAFHYLTHEGEGLEWMKGAFGVAEKDLVLSEGKGAAFEEITLITHAGTHVDAPWHYGPMSEGKKARTIDECPLEWFYGDGVVLDMRHKRPKERITIADLQQALERIDYRLKPLDIVLIMSGRDKFLSQPEYFEQPGMTWDSTLWLVNQGIKVIGVDMYGFDRRFEDMAEEFKRTGDGRVVWEAHFAGIQKEYCQIEKLANLDKIPQPYGFTISCFPVKIQGASGGWARPVAIVKE